MWRRAIMLGSWVRSSFSSKILTSSSNLQHNHLPHQKQYGMKFVDLFMTETEKLAKEGKQPDKIRPFITFVLGGPGSGKGTQCTKIAETFGFLHISAGELLRKEMSSNCEYGAIIRDIIKEGKIVPSEITVNLIHKAIKSTSNQNILIDGFPRSDENRMAFERIVGVEPDLVIFFDCPEDEMVKRVLSRNEGRIDDNTETVKKRLKVFDKLNLPVITYYSWKGKVQKINAVGTAEEIFEKVRQLFASERCRIL
ncbi:UMP-CMP kinase [Apostasia shenzhenica]|uniref:adenylate kinase n=1 Tax=Apostasia shenzhenica TaxID=1088818 RepID=A0A2I0AF93_9ASPA|nr:UMP-CMP kinase [Apostasia shenzhenica]